MFVLVCFEGCGSWWDHERDPLTQGIYQRTGDGKFDGETFLGRTWMFFSDLFFLGGEGEGKWNSRARNVETFLEDDTSSSGNTGSVWIYRRVIFGNQN
jgi:hypothetical protein